jgi:hypothetical protein
MSARSTVLATTLALAGLALTGAALPPPLPPLVEPEPELKPSAARFDLETTEHDFGKIFDDSRVTTEFNFKNTGPEPLIIGEVKSSCGCTVPELTKKVYQPGESGSIRVIFDPHNNKGFDSRTVTVQTNDASLPSARLTIKAFVRPLVVVEPSMVQFGQIDKGKSAEKEIIVAGRTEDFEATLATTNLPEVFDVKVLETKVREVGEGDTKESLRATRFLVTLRPDAPVGMHRAELTIRTNDTRRTLERSQAIAQVLGDLAVVPPRLSLGRVEAGASFSREFRVQSRSGEPFKIVGVETRETNNQMHFEFSPEDAKNPTVWRVVATGIADPDQRRIIGQIMVRTEVKGEENVEVRYNGFINPG